MSVLLRVLLSTVLSLSATSASAEPRLEWQVENPFRFFIDPADSAVHRATYEALTDQEKRAPVTAAERALGARHPEGWAATMVAKTCWNPKTNKFACSEATDYMAPKKHAVVAAIKDLDDAAVLGCTWLTTPKGRNQPRGKALTVRCDEAVRLDIPYPAGAHVSVEIGGREIAGGEVKVTDLLIVGMGDSFGSGEGNPDIAVRFSRERAVDYGVSSKDINLSGYPARLGSWTRIGDPAFIQGNARWLDQACHRSLYSNQLRTALQLAIEDPHRTVTFVGVACSGAEVTAGLFLRYKGNEWVPNPPELSQISAIAEAQCDNKQAPFQDLPEAYHMQGQVPDLQGQLVLRKCEKEQARKIDLLLVSIGGNDVGFARLVANAVLADTSTLKWLGGWMGHVHGATEAAPQIKTLAYRYKALMRATHNIMHLPWNEPDRVVLTAYPGLAILDDGRSICPDGYAGMDVLPAYFNLSEARARESTTVADKLNDLMRAASKEHGWTFVDAHRKAFLGRGICAGFTDNALSSADDLRLPRKLANGGWEPYNPADFQPYAPRQRWFRTPNDAFLTGNFHVASSVLQSALRSQSLSWFQLMLASTYSGAFHPSAEGHAAIADATVERARGVLAKYARPRPAE